MIDNYIRTTWEEELVGNQNSEECEVTNIVAGNDSLVSILFLCLPPASADIRYFEHLVFRKRNFVAVIGVRFVAVDGLRAVRVVEFSLLLAFCNASAGR